MEIGLVKKDEELLRHAQEKNEVSKKKWKNFQRTKIIKMVMV